MIVNLPLCTCSQGLGLVIVIESTAVKSALAKQIGVDCCSFRMKPVCFLLLAIKEYWLCLFIYHSSSWQESRVLQIGFLGIFLVLYQTCWLLTVPRLQFREGTLDWQALALEIPGEKGRGICDDCTGSYFSYNFLQAGFTLSDWKKALSA